MEVHEFIESGILELYVFGTLSDSETEQVVEISKKHTAVRDEILSIERAVISLSYSMAPHLSAEVYDRIREKLMLKHGIRRERSRGVNWSAVLGWAAAIALLMGIGYMYSELDSAENRAASAETEKAKMKDDYKNLMDKSLHTETLLTVVRDQNNIVVSLAGQAAAPHANAKVYWNRNTQEVYVDATGLPDPPDGMEYQVWSLLLEPALTPTSIGMLKDFVGNKQKIFAVEGTAGAQAFGITLEPAGGSASPTLEQLYTLGKV